jgi:hypothetical protein
MKFYIGFDDTDTKASDRGTGKLSRSFEERLPESCRLWGVVRQQLLLHDTIPFTSHNSSACVIVEGPDLSIMHELISRAIGHIERHSLPGSDPGLCLSYEGHPSSSELIRFGRLCTSTIVTQEDAVQAAAGTHLSGHGGTNDGIIGAAAAVGLTIYGWAGRFIEFGRLRDLPQEVYISDLERAGIAVVSMDRDAQVPDPKDKVYTNGWLRPRLWGAKPGLPVVPKGNGLWEAVGGKKRKQGKEEGDGWQDLLSREREGR